MAASGHGVFLQDDEGGLELHNGDGCVTVLMVLMPLNYTPESGFTGNFCMCFYPIKAIIFSCFQSQP